MNPTQSPTNPHAAWKAAHTDTPFHVGQISGRLQAVYGQLGEQVADCSGYLPHQESNANAAFIVRACNAHAGLSRAWSELAFHANALANARTKQERDAASLKVFKAIGDAKDALPELRTLSEIRAALQSATLEATP